jgi:hypothetical protein
MNLDRLPIPNLALEAGDYPSKKDKDCESLLLTIKDLLQYDRKPVIIIMQFIFIPR